MCRRHATLRPHTRTDQTEPCTASHPFEGQLAWLEALGTVRSNPWLAVQTYRSAYLSKPAHTDGVPAPAPPPPPPTDQPLTVEAQQIYQWLLHWRAQRASTTGLPAEWLAPNEVLVSIACHHMSLQAAASLGRRQTVHCRWA